MRPKTSQAVKALSAFTEDPGSTPNASQMESDVSSVKKKLKQSQWMDRNIAGKKLNQQKRRVLQPAWIEEEPFNSPSKMKKVFEYRTEEEGLMRAMAKRGKKEDRMLKWNKY